MTSRAGSSERIADARELGAVHRRPRARGSHAHPDARRGPSTWTTSTELLSRYVRGAEEIVEALRGLERFTALESEVEFERFLEVVRRAIGTLRSEDVLERPGRRVRAPRRQRRGGQLAARGSSSPASGSSVPPSARSRRRARQDPILLDDERAAISERAGTPLAPRAARGTEEELAVRAGLRGGARAARGLLRAPRHRGEPAAAAVGVLPRARLPARRRAGLGRARAAASRARTSNGSPATRSARPIPGGPLRDGSRRASARPRRGRSRRPSATAPTCRRASPSRWRSPPSSVPRPRSPARWAPSRTRRSDSYSEWDGALGPSAQRGDRRAGAARARVLADVRSSTTQPARSSS